MQPTPMRRIPAAVPRRSRARLRATRGGPSCCSVLLRVRKVVGSQLSRAKPVNGNVKVKNEILDIVDTTLFLGLCLDTCGDYCMRTPSFGTDFGDDRSMDCAYMIARTSKNSDFGSVVDGVGFETEDNGFDLDHGRVGR
ncbi:hypothetical protein EVAR_97470_1 [Eumeta japonica]|uniref:Uncharacterized protein n=1 Tax=Eumeta variegata TaxID=151549 RepID=A0A4C2A9F6_EUMVA|nr:hypothetical protein EVAR_97470_1 [Eumeta japonica]